MNQIEPFALERYFARHEFSARYLLSSSDCEALTLAELVPMAGEESRALWDRLKLGYTESQGHPLLRQEIAALYGDLDPDCVVVCTPEEGIFLIMQSLLQPGDHVITTFPGYQSLYEIARSMGCQISKWEPFEGSQWSFELEQLKTLLRPQTKLLVVNFPHNPTGSLLTHQEFQALLDLVRKSGVYLFSDEMYRFLEIEQDSILPSAVTQYKRAFSLFGMSKTFGLAGLRLGWIASQDHGHLSRLIELKDYTTICSSAPSEILALIALQNRSAIIARQRSRLCSNLNALEAFMGQFDPYFHWIRPLGGSICFPRMLKVKSALDFCNKMVAEAGIMLLPSPMFQYGDQHVRIGFGRENFQSVLTRFGQYLEMNQGEG